MSLQSLANLPSDQRWVGDALGEDQDFVSYLLDCADPSKMVDSSNDVCDFHT